MTDYNDGNWHGWNGGECPVHPETVVEVQYDDRDEGLARQFSWEHDCCGSDIVSFRVIKEHREPREFWVSNNDGYAHESLESVLSDPITEKHGYIHVREVIE